jgi:drug/metabolite transporter (DMT)-like permease
MATAWRTAFATFSFVFMNCLLNIFNSWALRRSSWPDFEYPVFYTMSHMIVTALAALLLLAYVTPAATGMPTLSQFWHYKEALVPVAICTTLNLGLNNLSLTLVSLFVNQAIKACTPLPVMVFSNRLAGKAYSRAIILCVALLVVGSIMANTHKMLLTSSKRTSLPGVVICITSMLANALRTVLVVILMNRDTKERPKLAPYVPPRACVPDARRLSPSHTPPPTSRLPTPPPHLPDLPPPPPFPRSSRAFQDGGHVLR